MYKAGTTPRLPRWAGALLTTLGWLAARSGTSSHFGKKILYLHVAKAGGTSFNRLLHDNFNGESHCEMYVEAGEGADGKVRRRLGNLGVLRKLDFISGHLTYPMLEDSGLNLNDYLLVTILRHPYLQTLSHLNWVIKISEDEDSAMFKNVTPGVQKLSQRLRAVEHWSPDVVIYWLKQYPGWFQNNQSRYFVSPDRLSVDAVKEVLGTFALVGVTERLDAFVSGFLQMAHLQSEKPEVGFVPHENRNETYRVPISILEQQKVQDFLDEYNQVDMGVYAHAERNLAP